MLSNSKAPLIIDADVINLIAEHPELLENHNQDIILTPHLGEMSRLIHKSISEIAENLVREAERFSLEKNIVCVLKDTRTVVTDGKGTVYLNQSGNNGMATGGSGDVLTGIIAGLQAQGMIAIDAATLGVYIHGLAGDSATSKLGPYGVMANDIVNGINDIVK